MPAPGDTVTLTQVVHPGLHEAWTEDRPYFERAYTVAEEPGAVVRMRFEPIAIPAMPEASIPTQTQNIYVRVSASLVDGDGQVVMVGGRGVIRPAGGFSQEVSGAVAFDQEHFIMCAAKTQAEDLIVFKRQLEAAPLLIPPAIEAIA
jgi:hypothetical protein